MNSLAILEDATKASQLSYYLRETFKMDVHIEELHQSPICYLLTASNVSDYVLGYIDGIVRQAGGYPILNIDSESDEDEDSFDRDWCDFCMMSVEPDGDGDCPHCFQHLPTQ